MQACLRDLLVNIAPDVYRIGMTKRFRHVQNEELALLRARALQVQQALV